MVVEREMYYRIIDNFLSRQECRHIIDVCRPRVRQGMSPNPQDNFKPTNSTQQCNNLVTWLQPTHDAVMKSVSERIAKETGYGLEYYEQVQILQYKEGMYYKLHLDNSYDHNPRKATFQIYLNNVEKGGETIFPHLGLTFKPKRGRAIFWLNFEDDEAAEANSQSRLTADPETIHEGAVIQKGEKWGYTQWIKLRPLRPAIAAAQIPSSAVPMQGKVKAGSGATTVKIAVGQGSGGTKNKKKGKVGKSKPRR